MNAIALPQIVLLAVFGLAGGIGISAVGPGGILPTIGLLVLTELSPSQVAGTAIVTHVATGALGTAAYARSGELRDRTTRHLALTLGGAALVGAPLGVLAGIMVSHHAFATVLGGVAAAAAGLVWWRASRPQADVLAPPPTAIVIVVGVGVAAVSGVVGIGGPMLTVPLLVALGLPVLQSLACAQAQSIVIASVGTVGYLTHDTIVWPLAALVGLPELAGVVAGWGIARALPIRALRVALVATLCVSALYLILYG